MSREVAIKRRHPRPREGHDEPSPILRLAHDRVVDRTGIKSRLEAEAQAKQFEETQRREGERAKAERAEMSKRVKAARRAASINVKSTPVRAAPKSMDDELREIARRVYGT